MQHAKLITALYVLGLMSCGPKQNAETTTTEEETATTVAQQPKQKKTWNTITQSLPTPAQTIVEQKLNVSDSSEPVTLSLGMALAADDNLSVSVLNPDGVEERFVFQSSGEFTFTPDAAGAYTILASSAGDNIDTVATVTSGNAEAEAPQAIEPEGAADAPRRLLVKAVVTFAKECKRYIDNGNAVATTTAPEGKYFAQPFVFLGRVGDNRKVTPVLDAKIALNGTGQSQELHRLDDFELAVFRQEGSLSKAEHIEHTRNFYQSYFGAGGEMYTVDTFRFGGDCTTAPTFSLDDSELALSVSAGSYVETIELRGTENAVFSTYLGDGTRMTDWTQCTFNRLTGEPTPYNGDGECKELSIATPPSAKLDYKLPSGKDLTDAASSDPTRLVFYGHGFSRAWYAALIENRETLASAAEPKLTLDRCLVVGGLVPLPLATEQTQLPLAAFNAAPGDIINVARRTGAYIGLPDLHQGLIDASGEITQATCIPSATETCAEFRRVKVQQNNCLVRADSGVTVLSASTSFIYPEYFELSGVVMP
jgi:hypothetical protein